MLLSSVAELVSLGMVVPFLGALTNPDILFQNINMSKLFAYFEISDPKSILLPMTLIFAFSAVFAGLARLLLIMFQTRIGYLIGAELGIEIYKKTLYQDYEIHMSRNTSEIISGITHKTTALVQQGIIAILTITSSLLLLLSITSILLFINFTVAFSTFLIFSSIYILVVILVKKELELKGKLVASMQTGVVKQIQEGLGAIRDVIVDDAQKIYVSNFAKLELSLRNAQITHIIYSTSPKFIMEGLGIAIIAFIAYFLLENNSSHIGVIPVLGAMALGAQRLLPLLQMIYANISAFNSGKSALIDALDLLDQPVTEHNPHAKKIYFNDKIEFKNLSFRYASTSENILENINLIIKKGSKIGISGITGSGKSTFLDVLMGLLHPSGGLINIDGEPLTTENKHLWRRQIAHVPQSIFLADCSIASNIAFGIDEANIDKERLNKAISLSQLSETVKSFHDGVNTLVGERGVRLSGGQRQRIGVARALYKGAKLIIFDEATSALDEHTEASLMNSINNLPEEITLIIVAHRLSTLDSCDQVFNLKNGNLESSR
jgi:ATP-binding cassette subfamily B protein